VGIRDSGIKGDRLEFCPRNHVNESKGVPDFMKLQWMSAVVGVLMSQPALAGPDMSAGEFLSRVKYAEHLKFTTGRVGVDGKLVPESTLHVCLPVGIPYTGEVKLPADRLGGEVVVGRVSCANGVIAELDGCGSYGGDHEVLYKLLREDMVLRIKSDIRFVDGHGDLISGVPSGSIISILGNEDFDISIDLSQEGLHVVAQSPKLSDTDLIAWMRKWDGDLELHPKQAFHFGRDGGHLLAQSYWYENLAGEQRGLIGSRAGGAQYYSSPRFAGWTYILDECEQRNQIYWWE
jgi:hypothetical protein